MTAEKEVLVEVNNVSKKFSKNLKRSLFYGLTSIFQTILGIGQKSNNELKKYEFWAVNNVSFKLKRGDCLGLIGHNGAGKSTLLKMLNGLLTPNQGEIVMRGKVSSLIELGAGFNPILTGRENIYVNGQILGFSKKEIDEKIENIIEFSEIREFVDSPVQNYSSGMKIRLGFAVAAQVEPDILIIDEVLAVGDLGFVLKCLKRIDQMMSNSAVIFVSHNMPQVSRICNQIILLEKGSIIFHGNNVPQGIDQYYKKFAQRGQNIIFSDNSIELVNISINGADAQKNEIPLLNWKESLEFVLHFKNHSLEFTPFISLTVFDKEQRGVAVINVPHPKQNITDFFTYKVKHENLQFSKGIYSISITLSREEKYDPILRIENVANFQVSNPREIWPSFLLESKIEVS